MQPHNSQPNQPHAATTHFGFREVDQQAKAGLVGAVFDSVAAKYDVMNDVMSFGVHRLWKNFTAMQSGLQAGDSVLDVASGSGDLAKRFARQVGASGTLVLTDINPTMLATAKNNMVDAGWIGNSEYVVTDAENLGFANDRFHCVCIAFGLRNVTHKQHALASLYRVTKPGGRLLILEFSKPALPWLEKFYDYYSFHIIPKIGKLIAGDQQSYQYLVESIRTHPPAKVLKEMMQKAGFEDIKIHSLSGGIVALHIGFKY